MKIRKDIAGLMIWYGITCFVILGLLLAIRSNDNFGFILSTSIQSLLLLSLSIYYTWIVTKKKINGENVLLWPVLTKMHIFEWITEKKSLRKRLLFEVGTLILVTVVLDVIATIGSFTWELAICRRYDCPALTILLIIPTILWAVFFIYSQAESWVYED